MAPSIQTLSEADRRLLAEWAAECAKRVLPIFEAENADDDRPRQAIARTRSYARGERDTAGEIRNRFGGGSAVRDASPAAAAAARSAGQASAVCHMGAHALGAAAYAIKAITLASPREPERAEAEIDWQVEQLTAEMRAALRTLPPVGEDRSGPLGPGLLASGQMKKIIERLQAELASG